MYPVVCERNKYNGLMTLLSLYPIKYLNELCLPYCSFLETNILLMSISSILIFFGFYCRSRFLKYFYYQNLCCFCSFLYTIKKKSETSFMIIIMIIIFLYTCNDYIFCLVLINISVKLMMCIHSNE